MRIETLLHLIDQEIEEYAVASLSAPVRRDAFEYGERSGYIQGLNCVKNLIDKQLSEEDESGQIRR